MIISLEDSIAENDILLVDSSAIHGGDESWKIDSRTGSRRLSSSGHFALVSEEKLQRFICEYAAFASILKCENVRTIPQTAEEIYVYQAGISRGYFDLCSQKKLAFAKKFEMILNNSTPSRREVLISPSKRALVADRHKNLYVNLIQKVSECVSLLKLKSIRINDPAYDEFVSMIKTLDKTLGLKKVTRNLMQKPDYSPGKSNGRDTDERLVTTAYWISMFSDKKVGVLTKDTDFFRLFGVISQVLGAKEFCPYNQMFRIPIHRNPVKVYYRSELDSCREFSTASAKYHKRLLYSSVGPKITCEIREKISQFWIHFSDYQQEFGIKFEN